MLWESPKRHAALAQVARPRAVTPPVVNGVSRELANLVESVAASSLPVLVCGESGVGKSTYVEALLQRSSRSRAPVVRVAGRALPTDEELFGVERRDASGLRVVEGQLAKADGGVLVVEDIDELPAGITARLLRLLHDGELSPVGSALTRRVDLRLVATCSAPRAELRPPGAPGLAPGLAHGLAHSHFPLTITVPPLRKRADDVEVLARHFARRATSAPEATAPFTRDALAKLRAHPWPGNAHELRRVVEDAVRAANGAPIDASHLALVARPADVDRLGERDRLVAALADGAWNQSRAAEILGVSRRTVIRKMQRFGIPRPRKP